MEYDHSVSIDECFVFHKDGSFRTRVIASQEVIPLCFSDCGYQVEDGSETVLYADFRRELERNKPEFEKEWALLTDSYMELTDDE